LKAQITKKHTPYRHIRRNVDSAVARKLLQMGLHKINSLNDLKRNLGQCRCTGPASSLAASSLVVKMVRGAAMSGLSLNYDAIHGKLRKKSTIYMYMQKRNVWTRLVHFSSVADV
jgi:hypothetical protein